MPAKELDRINKIVSDAAQEGKYSVYEEGIFRSQQSRNWKSWGIKSKQEASLMICIL